MTHNGRIRRTLAALLTLFMLAGCFGNVCPGLHAFAEQGVPAVTTEEPAPVEEPATEPVGEPAPVEEPVTEPVGEPAPVEEAVTEPAPVEEPATEPVGEPAPVEEAVTEPVEEHLPEHFNRGYVLVKKGQTVYTESSKREELGRFAAEAVVFAEIARLEDDPAKDLLLLTFDTREARDIDAPLTQGYIQFECVAALDGGEVERLSEDLKKDASSREYRDMLLPCASFAFQEAETPEEPAAPAAPEAAEPSLDETADLEQPTDGLELPDAEPTEEQAELPAADEPADVSSVEESPEEPIRAANVTAGLSHAKGVYTVGETVAFTASFTGSMRFATYTVIDRWGNELLNNTSYEKTQSWTPNAAGDYKGIVVVYDGAWHSAETDWFSVKDVPFSLNSLSVSGDRCKGSTLRFTIDVQGGMQFAQYMVIDQWGNNVLDTVSYEKTQDWTPSAGGDYKGIVIVYNGEWHSAETEWFAVSASSFLLKSLAISGNMQVGTPQRLDMNKVGEMQFASFTVINSAGVKVFETSVYEPFASWTPAAIGDYKGIVVAYDGEWHSAETDWFSIGSAGFALKGLSVSGTFDEGETLRFAADIEGSMQFASFSVVNQWGVKVFESASYESVLNWTPNTPGDYKGIVVVYDGAWHSAETNWFTVKDVPFSFNGVIIGGLMETGSVISFTLDKKGGMQFAGYKVIDQWGNVILENVSSENTQNWAPAAAGDYKAIIVVYNGEWHGVETEWFSIAQSPFTYEILPDGTSRLTKYTGNAASVVVPETFSGAVLTEIGEEAFEGNVALVEIDLPDTIKIIRRRAFADCVNLTTMK